jgi:hypothetical protein
LCASVSGRLYHLAYLHNATIAMYSDLPTYLAPQRAQFRVLSSPTTPQLSAATAFTTCTIHLNLSSHSVKLVRAICHLRSRNLHKHTQYTFSPNKWSTGSIHKVSHKEVAAHILLPSTSSAYRSPRPCGWEGGGGLPNPRGHRTSFFLFKTDTPETHTPRAVALRRATQRERL